MACEVFLGGSCNPTTWRSEIAIPTLQKLGITYYNPVCNYRYTFYLDLSVVNNY